MNNVLLRNNREKLNEKTLSKVYKSFVKTLDKNRQTIVKDTLYSLYPISFPKRKKIKLLENNRK